MNENHCPKCKKDALEFEAFITEDGECGKYDAICKACGFEGRQWYLLKFDGWQELKDDGQYVDLLGPLYSQVN